MRSSGSCLLAAVLLTVWTPALASAQTLLWEPSPEPEVAGYRLSYGTSPGKYGRSVDVGKVSQYAPNDVDWTVPHYFAVQSYTATGLVSPLSNEAVWTPPVLAVTALRASTAYPLLMNTPVTWTASVTGGQGQLEYQFWMFRRSAWVMVRNYGPSSSFTWTPKWEDQGGPYHVQVWVRAVGSTASLQAWSGTEAFTVMTARMEVTSDVDFPTPPDNEVTWTARVAGADGLSLEYKFWVYEQAAGTWKLLRDYTPSDHVSWVPASPGQYAIQAWARRAGSTAPHEAWAGTGSLEVARTPVRISSLTSDLVAPMRAGKAVTWSARSRGGMHGPLEYQFLLLSPKHGWVVRQPWSPNKRFTWTPTWGDEGIHAVQVWVRNQGSKAAYDNWYGTGTFNVERAPLHLTTSTLFPLAPGTEVHWRAESAGAPPGVEYQFWLFTGATGTWTIAKPYSPDGTLVWTPSAVDTYAIQAWAKAPGSGNPYDLYQGTGVLQVSESPARVHALTADTALPATAGTTIVWTAAASGGTRQLEYQFWHWNGVQWRLAQDYSRKHTLTLTTTGADIGEHAVQVWVRSAGSALPYEAHRGSGFFAIRP